MFLRDSQNRMRSNNEMACENQILHTIRPGDTLYSLARIYNTTVEQILALNPGTDIYNLTIGANLVICPGHTIAPPIGTIPPIMPPIGTLPPVTPVPPVGTLPVTDLLRELLMLILRWIREQFGHEHARTIMEHCIDELRRC